MDIVQNCDGYINITSSKHYRSYILMLDINRGKPRPTNFYVTRIQKRIWTEVTWTRFTISGTVAGFLFGNKASDVWIQFQHDMSGKVKEVCSASSRRSIPQQFQLWRNCPHVSLSSHAGNEICNYKLDKERSLMSESYRRLLTTLHDKCVVHKVFNCSEERMLQFCWNYVSYHIKINVEQL
jgi:hypothetical protein